MQRWLSAARVSPIPHALNSFETLAFLLVDVRLICHDEALELGSRNIARVDRMEASLLHVGEASVAYNPDLFKSTLGIFGIMYTSTIII
jgi:hypothetical protein